MPAIALEALWVAGLALATWLFWRAYVSVPVGGVNFLVSGDLFHYFWPAYAYVADRLRAGALAEWNPYQAAGSPFLATLQPGVLYPSRLLLLVTDVPTAMRWSTFAHIVFATLATWALCRALGAGRPGAAVGAVTFGVAFAVPNAYWASYLEAGSWLPVAALGLARFAAGGGAGWLALAGLAGGMPVIAGGYQVTIYVAYGLVLLGLALLADPRRRVPLGTMVAGLAFAGLLAGATAAPQLLPTLAWTSETARRAGALTDVQIDPLIFLRSKMVLLEKTFWRGGGFQPFYLSVPVALLAVVGFATTRGFGIVLGVATLVAYLLSFGPGTAWFGLYRWLPGLSMYRFPQRLFTLVAFASTIAAALGLTALLRARALAGRPPRAALAAAVGVLLVTVGLAAPYTSGSDFPWTARGGSLTGTPDFPGTLRAVVGEGRALLPADGAVAALPHRFGSLERIRVLQDYEPLSSRRLRDYLFALAGRPPATDDDPNPYTGGFPKTDAIARPVLLDLAAVRALVLAARMNPPERTPAFTHVKTMGQLAVWENPLALPRAYVVPRAQFVADEAAALAAITAAGFDGQGEVVLVGAAEGPDAAAVAAAAASPARAVRIALDRPEQVALDVDPTAPAVLVLADAYAPGWTVAVDGAERRLWQANHLVRGVLVRPGDRRVEFAYRTPGLRAGLAIAATAWTLVAAGAVGGVLAARRRAV
jgi:hypothetical protein